MKPWCVNEAGNQTLDGEVPASFVDSDFDMITEGSFMVPYSQISMNEQAEVISAHEAKEDRERLLNRNPSIQDKTI